MDHYFLISALEKYGFGKNFISWVKVLLKNQESSLRNGGTTTKYFLLGRRACQGDPISAYLFIFALDILFHLIRSKPKIKGLGIFDHYCLDSAYAGDKNVFLQDTITIKYMVDAFYLFLFFSELKPNLKKAEIAVIGALQKFQMTVCDLRWIDLNNDTLQILVTHFSYNEKLKEEKTFIRL